MGLFEFRKPGWRHKNPAVRLKSIENIDSQETKILVDLSRDDQDPEVRMAAINKLIDLPSLYELEKIAPPEDLSYIVSRKNHLLYNDIVNCENPDECRENLDQITSPEILAKLAVNCKQPAVRLEAVNKIDDQHLLTSVVKQTCGKKVAVAAMEKITDEDLLADLMQNAASKTSRRMATEKIAEFELQRKELNDNEAIAERLDALFTEATQLEANQDIDTAAQRFIEIKQEWAELDSKYIHPAYNGFNELYIEFEERYKEIINRRKTAMEKSARIEQNRARMDEICSTIERLSCSTDDDSDAVKKKAVADWEILVNDPENILLPSKTIIKRFKNACRNFDTNREKIILEKDLIKDFGKKCVEIQDLITNQKLKKAAVILAQTEKRLVPIELKYFNKIIIEKLVSEISHELSQAEEEVLNINLTRRKEICEELEQLKNSENHTLIEKQLITLKEDWQQLAKLENPEAQELEQRFHQKVDELTGKVQSFEQEKDWELWANLNLKEKLTEKVIALDLEENLETVVNIVKQSQVEWKKIGPVPKKQSQELWNKFHDACNRNFERAKPFLKDLKNKRIEAMNRRKKICVLADELAESTDWKKTTRTIKELQEEWKTLLHGSRSEEQKLYKKFRSSCDLFFERRQEYYKIKDEERNQNLIKKEQICEEAEKLAENPQIDYPKKIKRLQSDWKKIGPVPLKKKDAIWKRFRSACDKYFNWLGEVQLQNLKSKEELCETVEKLLTDASTEDNQKEVAEKITELQQQWKEIGPVPREQSEALWKRFSESCDLFFTARKKQLEKEAEQRKVNQSKKEELLANAEELASQSSDKKTAAQLQELQKEWFEIGSAPREINKELNDRFTNLCDAFFEGRRQYFIDLKNQQLENLKNKESLCLRLENILGHSYNPTLKKQDKALSLAEELKQSMENNFMLAGRRNGKKGITEEVNRIKQEWDKIGPVPHKQARALTDRYNKSLDAYQKRQQSQKPNKS